MRKAIKSFVREFKNRSTKPAFFLPAPLLETPKVVEPIRETNNVAIFETKSAPAVEERRILPSLIETTPDPLALRLQDAEKKRKRAGRKPKPKASINVVAEAPSIEPSVAEQQPSKRSAHIPHRTQRSIQMRWVLKIGRPGENWKHKRSRHQFVETM